MLNIRHGRWLVIVAAGLLNTLIAGLYSSGTTIPSLSGQPGSSLTRLGDKRFHSLVQASASDLDICNLLLSGAVTGYPDPMLLGCNGHGLYNGAESHLFKIWETSAYLGSQL